MRDKQPVTPPVTKPSVPNLVAQFDTKPVTKILATAGDKVKSTNLSIKKIMNPQTDGFDGYADGDLPREPIDFDELKMSWRRFASEMKSQGMETIYNAMIKRDPKPISETHYLMEVDNLIQVSLVNADMEKLTTYMRKALKNFDFFLEVKETENQQEDVKQLNSKDKFTMLARKFPNLHSLKNIFSLEIE